MSRELAPMNHAPIRSVEAFCFRYPLAIPVVTSFGRMLDRPAVLVRLVDEEGGFGWGEAWCNFPSTGAEHRARLIGEVLGPGLVGRDIGPAGDLFGRLSASTAVLALQCGEPGPFAQAIAAFDTAHWDLRSRQAGRPLWRMLGGVDPRVRVYASGINPADAAATASRAKKAGHRAFKLKIGFDEAGDLANLAALRAVVGSDALAADANQAWSVDEALRRIPELSRFDLDWLEEPVRADLGWETWRVLVARGGPPLAGGENISGEVAFDVALREGVLSVIQPDLAKWGGVSLCARVGRAALEHGRRFCPHYLGGGIGLLASAHLLAGVGGDGLLEIDVNENPLRDACCGSVAAVSGGVVTLSEEPGLGAVPDLGALDAWRTV